MQFIHLFFLFFFYCCNVVALDYSDNYFANEKIE